MADRRKLHPNLRIFDHVNPDKQTASFVALPSFFTEELMRVGRGIPASFWKLTLVLMRGILSDQEKDAHGNLYHTYVWKSTVESVEEAYDIGDRAMQDWTNAFSVSGLFSITRGKKKVLSQPGSGTPTVWRYNPHATRMDWICFIAALAEILNQKPRMARSGQHRDTDCAGVFKLALACKVDEIRHRQTTPLPQINESKIDAYIRRGYGYRNEAGVPCWRFKIADDKKAKVLNIEF